MGNITFHNIGAFLHHKRRKEETFMLTNVFVKPNEQNRACSSYAMARKRRMKSNFSVLGMALVMVRLRSRLTIVCLSAAL